VFDEDELVCLESKALRPGEQVVPNRWVERLVAGEDPEVGAARPADHGVGVVVGFERDDDVAAVEGPGPETAAAWLFEKMFSFSYGTFRIRSAGVTPPLELVEQGTLAPATASG